MLRELLKILFAGTREQARKRNTWVTIALSFVVAVTLWFIVTLNTQVYQTPISYPVKVVNVPEQMRLRKEVPPRVNVMSEGPGIDLLFELYAIKKDTVKIDFQKHERAGQFSSNEYLKVFTEVLPPELTALEAFPDTIDLSFDEKASKRVPVVNVAQLNFPPSYRAMGEVKLQPDSVLVIGPKEDLEAISYWKTVDSKTELIDKKRNLYIPLDTSGTFRVIPSEVKVTVTPRQFTESYIEIPIEIINVPEGSTIALSNTSVKVHFLVPLSNYGVAKPQSFVLRVDFNKLNTNTPYVIPELIRKPEAVEISRMDPAYLEYTIVRKR